jgi:hypothetical protein
MASDNDELRNTGYPTYVRIAPYAIVGGGVIGYLIAGGVWWGIPVVVVVGLVYAAFRIRLQRGMSVFASRVVKRRSD